MSQEHQKRVVSAVIGVITLFGIYFTFGHWGLVFLTVLISSAAYYEFVVFSGAGAHLRWIYTLVGFALSAWLSLGLPAALMSIYLALMVIMFCGLYRAHLATPADLSTKFLHAQSRGFGLLYIVVSLSFLPRIHSMVEGGNELLFLLLIIWLGDTSAYYGGKTMGRRKLSVNVSPGKTLEGSATALVTCGILALVYRPFALPEIAAWKLVVIAVLSSVVAQAGDLIESLMKRAYQVKDSGHLIPGHGGVFDRFDSLILAAPFYYFLLQIFV